MDIFPIGIATETRRFKFMPSIKGGYEVVPEINGRVKYWHVDWLYLHVYIESPSLTFV